MGRVDKEARMAIKALSARGSTSSEIARLLCVTEGAVRYHAPADDGRCGGRADTAAAEGGSLRRGNRALAGTSGRRKGVRSVLSQKVAAVENPIYFKPLNGDLAYGCQAEVLIEVCDALIEARNEDKLAPSQRFLAVQAEFIIRSAAKVGIISLVDEATGYQDKTKDEYRKLFDKFIRAEFRQWEQEFPDKFFDMIYRLYGLKRQKPDSTRHPQFFGKFIRKYVYYPLANSNGAILERLEEKNPVVYDGGGGRRKFLQYLTEEIGMNAFRQHLWQVVGIGEASQDKRQFDRGFYRGRAGEDRRGQASAMGQVPRGG